MYSVNSVIVPTFWDKMNITLTTSDLDSALTVYIFRCPTSGLEGCTVRATMPCIRRWSWAEHHRCYRGCPAPSSWEHCHHWFHISAYSKESFVRMDLKHQNLVILWWCTYTITSRGVSCPPIILYVITIMLGPVLLCERNTFLFSISFASFCRPLSECHVHVNSL